MVLLLLAALLLIGMAAAVRFGLKIYYRAAYPMQYAPLVDSACKEKNLDRALVYAIIRTESGFNPNAVSGAGARGLMQLMPDALDWVRMRGGEKEPSNYEELFDPKQNIEYGTRMLKLLFDEFETTETVLCAYHAGWGSVKDWLKNPAYAPDGKTVSQIPFKDTAHYVSKVQKTVQMYRRLYQL
jgi:soluble lytic murein transglycosylase